MVGLNYSLARCLVAFKIYFFSLLPSSKILGVSNMKDNSYTDLGFRYPRVEIQPIRIKFKVLCTLQTFRNEALSFLRYIFSVYIVYIVNR